MQNSPVHWYEGLFLRPHHLQANDRYWAELAGVSARWENPYNYGVYDFQFSKEALANYQLDVHVLRARMPDGTVVDLEHGRQPDRLAIRGAVTEVDKLTTQLGDAFGSVTTLRVYLGVPKLKLGRTNCSPAGEVGDARYRASRLSVADESRGGHEQEIEFRDLNARLLLSTDDLSGYDLLPIAQIKRAADGEAAPQLDPDYIPPLLTTHAWPGLDHQLVRPLYDLIGQKIEVLSQQVVNRGMARNSQDPGELQRISMLEKLNETYATLSVMAFAQQAHPLTTYTELVRALGQLSIFTPERRVGEVPRYDHDDLARIYREIDLRIRKILLGLRELEFEQRYFLGVGLGMQVSLEPKWFHSNWEWCIGVRKGDLSMQECRQVLSPGVLDWKFASSRQVENIFLRRAQGIELRPLDRPLRALPASQDWTYFEVLKNDSPAWRDVVETQTLAMRLKDSLILNKDRLQGEREITVAVLGKKVDLQFALFAIPNQA
ncbi:MAG: type VI secretion system baseplate subunit TssK [Lacipirellulaceae bacterium]